MKINSPIKPILFIVWFSINIISLHAKEFAYKSVVLAGSDITANKSVQVLKDADFETWLNTATVNNTITLPSDWNKYVLHKRMKGSVVFRFKGETIGDKKLSTYINEEITVNITGYQWVNGAKVAFSRPGTKLKVSYGYSAPNAFQTQALARLDIDNVVEITATVTAGLANSAANSQYLELYTQISSERIYEIAKNNDGTPVFTSKDLSYIATRNQLKISWSPVAGAEEYDLEWIHVDAEGNDNTANIELTEDLFRKSTRVTVTTTDFNVPLIYEAGWLIFRVRALGRMVAKPELGTYGLWSTNTWAFPVKLSTVPASSKHQIAADFENTLNWQSSVSFAEEGKNKAVISYFDGSSRNRQSVTRLNSKGDKVDGEAIAGEIMYDHTGRGTLNILPVPTGEAKLNYKKDFNRNTGNVSYSKTDFDLEKSETEKCDPLPGALSDDYGAGKYYSDKNDIKTGANAFIPDAEGYPLSQVEYTRDNTGRIKRQSGVGKNHQLGSGHETINFYGTPNTQDELDRLFGSDVGYYQHYKKNVTVDPNGQVTVSYLDLDGKVIATTMAGDGPSGLKKLGKDGRVTIDAPLFDSNNPDPKTKFDKVDLSVKTKTFDKTLLISDNSAHNFNYQVIPEKLFTNCEVFVNEVKTINQKCYNCVIQASVMVTDACGVEYLMDLDTDVSNGKAAFLNKSILNNIQSGNYSQVNTSTAEINNGLNTSDLNWGKNVDLKVGEYNLTRVLKVNQQALDYYISVYLKSPCVKEYDGFLIEETAKIDVGGCNVTCDNCIEKLGEYSQYDFVKTQGKCAPCLTYDEYELQQKLCLKMCEKKDETCDGAYQQMLGEVSPGGQYGKYLKDVEKCARMELVKVGDVVQVDDQGNQRYYCAETYNVKQIDEKVEPLSVYNTGNALPKGNANWKHPVHAINGNADYYENDGITLSKVRIYCANKSGNECAVDLDGNAYSLLEQAYDSEGEILPNLYLTKPKYISKFTDFIKNWRPSWAVSLVTYHPEYGSISLCRTLQETRDFDYNLRESRYETGRPSDMLLISEFLKNPESSDPFFNTTKYPGFAREQAALKAQLTAYGVKMNTATPLSLFKIAYITAKCPGYDEGCPYECLPVNFTDQSPGLINFLDASVWEVYKNLYIGEKIKIYEAWGKYKSITATNSYNGCIGNTSWNKGTDRFIDYTYNTNCRTVGGETVRYRKLRFLFWQSGCHRGGTTNPDNSRECIMVSPQRVICDEYNRSQAYNPAQACSKPYFYEAKTKVFMHTEDNYADPALKSGGTCYELPAISETTIDDKLYSQSLQEAKGCENFTTATFEAMDKEAKRVFLEECKECPVTKSLTDLFNATLKQGAFAPATSANAIELSCYPKGLAEFTTSLMKQLGLEENTRPIKWLKKLGSNTSTEYVIEIASSSPAATDKKIQIHFFIEAPYKWDEILSFCCMNYVPDLASSKLLPASAFTSNPGGTFKIGGKVSRPVAANDIPIVSTTNTIVIEGYIDYVLLNSCNFRICRTTGAGNGWTNLINALLFQRGTGTTADANNLPQLADEIAKSANKYVTIYNENAFINGNSYSPEVTGNTAKYQMLFSNINEDMFALFYTAEADVEKVIGYWKLGVTTVGSVSTFRLEAFDKATNLSMGTAVLELPSGDLKKLSSFKYANVEDATPLSGSGKKFNANVLETGNVPSWKKLEVNTSFDFCDCKEHGYYNPTGSN